MLKHGDYTTGLTNDEKLLLQSILKERSFYLTEGDKFAFVWSEFGRKSLGLLSDYPFLNHVEKQEFIKLTQNYK